MRCKWILARVSPKCGRLLSFVTIVFGLVSRVRRAPSVTIVDRVWTSRGRAALRLEMDVNT